jgi:hypothetical protein
VQAAHPGFDALARRATMPSLRAFTRAMSTRRPPTSKPNSAPRCAWRMARALATSVLVGTQPTLTQVPPKWWRSITAVFSPSLLQRAAMAGPAWPAPTTMASKRPIQVDLERRGDGGHIVVLAGPDRTRVPHAVLGDDVEATRVLWLERHGLDPLRRLDLPAPYVLEDIAPRVWRAADGRPGLLSVRSGPDGGGLVLIDADPADRRALRIAAEGPPIGTRMRWLSPSTDGRRIVAVHTPHIGGVLHVYRRAGGRLEPQRRADGVSNHRLGARELDVSAWLGDRLLMPSQDGGMLQVFSGADLRRAEDVPLPERPLQMAVEHGAIAAACLLADGSVVRIVPPT